MASDIRMTPGLGTVPRAGATPSRWTRPLRTVLSRESAAWAIAVVTLGAALLQLGLFGAGFYRLESDESARSLMAWDLSWANASQPWIWPPFYKIAVGLFLKVVRDVFLGPRILTMLAGLGTLLVLVALAHALFRNRAVDVATAALAALVPERLIFSTVPMSDIFYFLFLTGASLGLLRWFQARRTAHLLAACGLILLAATVRYEAILFGLVLGLFLTWQLLVARSLGLGAYLAAGLILAAFPVFWLADSYLWYGSTGNLAITSQQFIAAYGRDYALALREMPLLHFLRAIPWQPLLLAGLAMAVLCAGQDAVLRRWLVLLWIPLLLISLMTVGTLSVTQAASWRTAGFWVLLLLPFEALALVQLAARLGRSPWRRAAVPLLVALALLPPALRDARFIRSGMINWNSRQWREERPIGLFLRDALARHGGGRVLLDSSMSLDFLDVLAGSTVPDRFVLTANAPVQEVSLAVPMRAYYERQANAEVISRLLGDHFDLARGGNARALQESGIYLILVRSPEFISGLDASPLVQRERKFSDWVLYRVRE